MNELQILEAARRLPSDAKQRLFEVLNQDAVANDPDVKAVLMPILKKRDEDYLADRSKGSSLEESMKRLRERVNAKIQQSSDHQS